MLRTIPTWSQMAALFLIRSPRTTVVLSLMVIAAVSAMIFLAALCVGVNDAMIRNSVELFSGHITCSNLPAGFEAGRLRTDGVKGVLERTAIQGIATKGSVAAQLALIGVNPEQEARFSALPRKVIEGRYLTEGDAGLLIGAALAKRLGVRPGQSVIFRSGPEDHGVAFEIAGVFRTGLEQLDGGTAFCSLGFLPAAEAIRTAGVFLEKGVDPQSVMARYRSSLPDSVVFKSWKELMPDLEQLIELNYVSMEIVLGLVFAVVSLGIGCAIVIIVLKNIREFGILKAMGVTSGELATLVALQVLWMTLSAAAVGLLLGVGSSWLWGETGINLSQFTSHNRYFAVSGIIFPRMTAFSLLTPPALALASGFVASFWPIGLILRRKPAEILRII